MSNIFTPVSSLVLSVIRCGLVIFLQLLWPLSAYSLAHTCGPNATGGTFRTLVAIENFFRDQVIDKKKKLCWDLYSRKAASVWDIEQLRRGGSNSRTVYDSNYRCEDTVELVVDGQRKCFNGWAVNYLAWGLMNRLCGEVSFFSMSRRRSLRCFIGKCARIWAKEQ